MEEVTKRSFLSVPLPRFSLKSKAGKGVLTRLCHYFRLVTLLGETLFTSLSLCSFICRMGIIIINAFSVLIIAEWDFIENCCVIDKELHKCKVLLLLHSKKEALKLSLRSVPAPPWHISTYRLTKLGVDSWSGLCVLFYTGLAPCFSLFPLISFFCLFVWLSHCFLLEPHFLSTPHTGNIEAPRDL